MKVTIKEWIAIIICIGVPVFLMYQNDNATLLSIPVITYVVAAGLQEWKKKPYTTYAPLVAYAALIIYGAVRIALVDEVFYKERTEVLVNIVKYGSILLLSIPFIYNINKIKE